MIAPLISLAFRREIAFVFQERRLNVEQGASKPVQPVLVGEVRKRSQGCTPSHRWALQDAISVKENGPQIMHACVLRRKHPV